jgi:dehydrogenase/reductase SDR family protein 7B
VDVLVVSPGYVRTELSRRALTADGTAHGETDATTAAGCSPAHVAEQVVEAVVGGRRELLLAPLLHRLAVLLRALLPSLYFFLMARRARAA